MGLNPAYGSGGGDSSTTLSNPYVISCFLPGTQSDDQKVIIHPISIDTSFPVNFSGSYATLGTAPAAETTFSLLKNGVTIGSLVFALGATEGVFSMETEVSLVAGDELSVVGPATADSALADLRVSLKGVR